MAKGKFVYRDGHRLAVVRPSDPDKALRDARALLGARGAEAGAAFEALLWAQPFRYVGLAGTKQELLDTAGIVVGKLEPGDSFVPFELLIDPPPDAPAAPPILDLPSRA